MPWNANLMQVGRLRAFLSNLWAIDQRTENGWMNQYRSKLLVRSFGVIFGRDLVYDFDMQEWVGGILLTMW